MFYDFINQVNELKRQKRIFAIAIVTGRKAPISGKPGDKGIVLQDGRLIGWIGGGCTQNVVIVEAKKAMKDGKIRVVRISPDKIVDPLPDVVEYNMTCHSGGDVEVYIEPVLPQPQLIIVGKSLVAQTLEKLGKILDYSVSVIVNNPSSHMFPNADNLYELNTFDHSNLSLAPYNFVVVSTQGEDDELGLEKMLQFKELQYISFVASRKKADAVFNYLLGAGLTPEEISQIRVPAGLDINAKTPKEVALSILAEIIQISRSGMEPLSVHTNPTTTKTTTKAVDQKYCPTCDMLADTQKSWEYKGKTYYFCCAGCEKAFKKDPESFLTIKQ